MIRPTPLVAAFALALIALSSPVFAEDVGERAPGPKARGEVYEWKSEDGLVYQFRIPKEYKAGEPVNLTLILHGSNLDRRWGFANHSHKTFRPDDVVVSPDGTTSNGSGGFNFLGEKKDAKRLHALIEELKKIFELRGVYLYGHSQGSFFAFYYAGEFPADVTGVVGHASGVWNWTKLGEKGHRQAIVLMHGTQDPVVPYGQSEGGYEAFARAKYPTVRLRSLEGWNHWPSEHNMNAYNQAVPHTSHQIAWVEGMTTEDPDRLAWCFDLLTDNKFRERHDYAAAYTLARHVEGCPVATETLKKKAARVTASIDALAQAHVDAIEKDMPKDLEFEKAAWPAHMMMFLRTFRGTPVCEAFFERWSKALEKHQDKGIKHFTAYWAAINQGDRNKAFEAAMKALDEAFLYRQLTDYEVRRTLKAMRAEAEELKLSKKVLKVYDARFDDFEQVQELGTKAFDGINKKHGKLL